MNVGITGHQRLGEHEVEQWVERAIRARLATCRDLYGLSSLAVGSDQIFARAVLDLGGRLEAVLPFPDYEHTFNSANTRASFCVLLERCSKVTTLKFVETTERSYLLAGQYISDRSDLLISVWNGEPAAGMGGTADIVAYANKYRRPIHQLNPITREILDWD